MKVPVQEKHLELELREQKMKCWATLLAHTSGFAAINAGGTLQQVSIFNFNPAVAFIPIIITQLIIQGLFRISQIMRRAMTGHHEGKREKLFDEFCIEAENDISSLSMSFNTANVIR